MIPAFNISGVLPPFEGENAAQPTGLSPYPTTMWEVATRFSYSQERRSIIAGLLEYRRALRDAGFTDCFQWLDGSFCEDCETLRGRAPGDVDVVTFFRRPPHIPDIEAFADQRGDIFDSEVAKETFKVDAYLVDLSVPAELVVRSTVYWYGLFSHQRATSLWKGMLQVQLGAQADDDMVSLVL